MNCRMNKGHKPILTVDEAIAMPVRVLALLEHHRGAANPITGAEIAKALGQADDRKVRMVIQQLIADGHTIAASVGKLPGYYLIGTREEAESYMRVLKSRAVKTFERMRDIGRAVEREFGVPYQPALFAEMEAKTDLNRAANFQPAMRLMDRNDAQRPAGSTPASHHAERA